ncbi:hypothetical protein [Methylobacterium sp. JK268]
MRRIAALATIGALAFLLLAPPVWAIPLSALLLVAWPLLDRSR